jgi:hypothetical protein
LHLLKGEKIMKRFLTNGIVGILCFTIYGFTTLPAQALPVALLGGAASHLFHFGGAASGVLHASHALGATSSIAKSATYSRGLTASRFASSNAYRASAMAPKYASQGFHTPGMTQLNTPRMPTNALPPGAPVGAPPPGAPIGRPPVPWGPGPYWGWDHDDAAWFVGGVFVGAAITPLFIAQPVYYYPAYPGYYVVPSDVHCDSSDSSSDPSPDKDKPNMKVMEKDNITEPTAN